MRRYIALLLVLVMLLAACGTAHPSDNTSNPTNTEQNGTAPPQSATSDPTQGTTAPIPTTNPTGDSSGTGTTDATTETGNTLGSTDETTKPTQGSTVPGDYTLKISRSTLSLNVGQIGNLTAEYTGTGTLIWESSDTSKATVSNGTVTAKAAGTVVITVRDGVKKSQCQVTITKPVEETQPPKEVTLKLNKSSLSLKVGESYTLSVTYTGNKSLTWSSTNSSVATVSNGKVTARSAGNAVITVDDGVKKAQCYVTVSNVETPKEVKLSVNPTSLNLVVGNTSTLTYEYTGTGKLTWRSSNASVVTVSNGKVTAKAAGQAVVTLSDGTRNAQCHVTVNAPAPAPAATFKINTKEDTVVFVGNTLQIDYTYTGNKSLTWTSDDTSVLTVDNDGMVTAKSVGYAMIKVTDGSSTKRVTLKVEESKPLVTSFEWSSKNAPLYDGVTKYAGDYMSFKLYARPYGCNPNITVTSSNSGVVSASYKLNGSDATEVTLNFKSAGTATITIKSADGGKSESYTITVKGDYSCNPGGGQLTPEQFVNAYNGVTKALGMDNSYTPSGYLVLTLSPSELTWAKARNQAEGAFHHWYSVGKTCLVLTYEETNADGNYVFYVHR